MVNNSASALEKFVGGKEQLTLNKETYDHSVGGAVGYSFNLGDDVSGHGEPAIIGYDNRAPEGNPNFITGGGKHKGKKRGTKKRSMRSKKSSKGRKMRKVRKTMKRSRK